MAVTDLFQLKFCVLLLQTGTVACGEQHGDLVGKDLETVVEMIDDKDHMVVWPRDYSNTSKACSGNDYVTIVPKSAPSYAIEIRTDSSCKVTSIKRRARKGL